MAIIDDQKRSESPDTASTFTAPEEDLEEMRKKFIGEIDLPESRSSFLVLSPSRLTFLKARNHYSKNLNAVLYYSPFNIMR